MGRKALFGKPLTQTERNRRYLDKLKALASQASKPAPSGSGAGPSKSDALAHDDDPRQTDLEQFIASM